MRSPIRAAVTTLAVLTIVLGTRDANAQRCSLGFTADTTRRVFDTLRSGHDAACTFDGVETEGSVLEARFHRDGRAIPSLSFHLEDCDRSDRAPRLVSSVPDALATACPAVARAARALAPEIASRPFAGDAPSGGLAPRVAMVVSLLLAIALGAYVARQAARRFDADDRTWMIVAAAGFVVALAVRIALPSTPSNWYLDVLPPRGPPTSTRFGAGAMALPYLLRAVHLWSEPMLFALIRCTGALAAALVVWIVRESRGTARTAAIAALLVAIAPLHARVSASGSEHVISSTLTLAALATWLYAVRTRDRWSFGLSALLAILAAGTRVDATPQLFAIPAWSLLRDRVERDTSFSWRRALRDTALAYVFLAVVVVAAAWFIARPARHPYAPVADLLRAARELFKQYWLAARMTPRWIALGWVVASFASAVALAVRRPLLLARVLIALACTYIPLGRTLAHPFLIELRYFLFAIVIGQLPIAFALDLAIERIGTERMRVVATAGACFVLAAAFVFETRSAFVTRFTYEDEYMFLRTALAGVPAGCTVVSTPQRLLALPADADCCLDVPHSPIVLRYPDLNFVRLDRFPLEGTPPGSCAVYYESPLCSGDTTAPEWRDDLSRYHDACVTQRTRGTFEPIGETRVSPRSTRGVFDRSGATARLFRWRR